MQLRTLLVISMSAAALTACGDDPKDATKPVGDCSADQTFAKVGSPFLEKYCFTCHSTAMADKLGDGHDFGDEDKVFEHAHAMVENLTGGGTPMPPEGFDQPTTAEKQKFLDWLDCSGAAEGSEGHEH